MSDATPRADAVPTPATATPKRKSAPAGKAAAATPPKLPDVAPVKDPLKAPRKAPAKKEAKAAAPAAAKASGKAPKAPAELAPKAKQKLVRDSFTMPQADFDLIDQLKARAIGFGRPVKKSELLRAGLQALAALNEAQLGAALETLVPLKPGRPKKGS